MEVIITIIKGKKVCKKHTKDTSTLYDVLYSTTLEFHSDIIFDLLSDSLYYLYNTHTHAGYLLLSTQTCTRYKYELIPYGIDFKFHFVHSLRLHVCLCTMYINTKNLCVCLFNESMLSLQWGLLFLTIYFDYKIE